MSRFFAEQPNPLDVVVGQCKEYPCSTISAVDLHLVDLLQRISTTPKNFPNLIERYRDDFDKLLDRRLWLEMTATPVEPKT